MKHKIMAVLRGNASLKAKEIAREIESDRKTVNSFLHKNLDVFQKCDDFRWKLVDSSVIRIEFNGNQWVNSDRFESSLLLSGSPLDSSCDEVLFALPQDCKILLDAAARFLALSNQLCHIGKLVTIDFSDCMSTFTYFDRIGFIDQLDVRVVVLPKRPAVSKAEIYKGNSDTVVEFAAINPELNNKTIVNQLTNQFVELSDRRFEAAVFTVFSEFVGNISEHSQTPLKGFAALQIYGGKRKHIQTVVSDSGLGIVKTLMPALQSHHPDLYRLAGNNGFHQTLVTEVLTKGEISRFGAGRGLGYKSSREHASKFDARLSLRQTDFSVAIDYQNGQIANVDTKIDLSRIDGTHICFDFFVD